MTSLHATFGTPVGAYPEGLGRDAIEACREEERCRLVEIDAEMWVLWTHRLDDYEEIEDA